MNKTWLNIALILLIFLNGMGYTLIQIHFYLDREQITALYCVNRDKPEMECEGKCELGKRLSEAKSQQKNQEEITLEELSLIYTLEDSEVFCLKPFKPRSQKPLMYNHNDRIPGIDWEFFHPPRA